MRLTPVGGLLYHCGIPKGQDLGNLTPVSDDKEQKEAKMQLAHVLFMDIVAYSQLPTDEQSNVLATLQQIVRGTAEVVRAKEQDKLISLATGDGIALVFFNDPMAPVQCAMEINRALKGHPNIKVRMGIHSGPVDKIVDVNDSVNVAGAGINMAQRVMDSGDAGHILVSRRVAEDLAHYSTWQPLLHDLEEVEVKHGVRIHMFNLYDGDVGNANLPEKIRQKKKKGLLAPAVGIAVLGIVLVVAAIYFVNREPPGTPSKPMWPESEFAALLQKKTETWTEAIFAAQAPNGGLKASPGAADATVQAWATAQGMTAVFSTQNNLETYISKIRNAFDYIEKKRRRSPAEGWNFYDNANPYTITEINGWVTLAYIKSLDSKTPIWNAAERQDVVKRIIRDLEEIKRRQDASGGWRPIRDGNIDYVRTYSTVIAVWALIEARRSAPVKELIGSQYDENIRTGTNWLLRNYKEGQGWVQNPGRGSQKEQYDGLTAQALFALSRVEGVAEFAYLKSDPTYLAARKGFVKNRQLAPRAVDKDNSHITDADVGFTGSEFLAEGSTFLWFPWTLLELTQLSSDAGLSPEEQRAATQLRSDILNTNHELLSSYAESSNFTYQYAENLFCVSGYVNAIENGK